MHNAANEYQTFNRNIRMLATAANAEFPSETTTSTTTTTLEKWLCDYCQEATFINYQDACTHEDSCRYKLLGLNTNNVNVVNTVNNHGNNNKRKQQTTLSSFMVNARPKENDVDNIYVEPMDVVVEKMNDSDKNEKDDSSSNLEPTEAFQAAFPDIFGFVGNVVVVKKVNDSDKNIKDDSSSSLEPTKAFQAAFPDIFGFAGNVSSDTTFVVEEESSCDELSSDGTTGGEESVTSIKEQHIRVADECSADNHIVIIDEISEDEETPDVRKPEVRMFFQNCKKHLVTPEFDVKIEEKEQVELKRKENKPPAPIFLSKSEKKIHKPVLEIVRRSTRIRQTQQESPRPSPEPPRLKPKKKASSGPVALIFAKKAKKEKKDIEIEPRMLLQNQLAQEEIQKEQQISDFLQQREQQRREIAARNLKRNVTTASMFQPKIVIIDDEDCVTNNKKENEYFDVVFPCPSHVCLDDEIKEEMGKLPNYKEQTDMDFTALCQNDITISRDSSIPNLDIIHKMWTNAFSKSSFDKSITDNNVQIYTEKYPIQDQNDIISFHNRCMYQKLLSFLEACQTTTYDDFGDEEDSSHVLLLKGPLASGKTALIHFLAEQSQYALLEMNTNQKRNSSSLKKTLEEATQSHIYSRMMVLVEDVDVVLEPDVGFYSALSSVIPKAKCPIIMTCQRVPEEFSNLPCVNILELKYPTVQECTSFLHNVVGTDNVELDEVVEFYGCDLRKCLLELQCFDLFWRNDPISSSLPLLEERKVEFKEKHQALSSPPIITSIAPHFLSFEFPTLLFIRGHNFTSSVQLVIGSTICVNHVIDENFMYALVIPPSNLSHELISQRILPVVAKNYTGYGIIGRSDNILIESQRYWNVEFDVPITNIGSTDEDVMEFENLDDVMSGTISTRTYERLLPLFQTMNNANVSSFPRKVEIEDRELRRLELASDMQLINDSFDMPYLVAPAKIEDDKVLSGNEDTEHPYNQYYTSSPSLYSKRERRLCYRDSLNSSSVFDYSQCHSLHYNIPSIQKELNDSLLYKKQELMEKSLHHYNQKLYSMNYSQTISSGAILDSLSLIRTMVHLEVSTDKSTQQPQQPRQRHRRSNRLAGQKVSSRYLQRAFRSVWTEEEESWFQKGFLVYDR